ncbi:MAG: MFS transporter [Deltaproteobacteria bacterium]|nr:MFS transporter [Deltaproteobacteria bacterium]
MAKYFYGYNIVGAGFALQGMSIGALFTYGVFFKEFQNEFGWSRAMISGASSLSFLIMGLVGILMGKLNDRTGPKRLVVASAISFGIGYLFMAYMQAPWHLYLLYGLFVGIGLGAHDVITLSTVARWFVRRRGLMTGIVKVGTGAGQLTIPLVATVLIAAYGWRTSYLIMGAALMLALVGIAQFLRLDPREMGLLPDGDAVPPEGVQAGSRDHGFDMKAAFRTVQFWILCGVELIVLGSLLTIIVQIVPHAMDLGLSPVVAAGVLSTIGGVSMAGRLGMGAAIDRIGGKRALIICFIIIMCGFACLLAARSAWMLFLFAIIYGFAHGGFFTVMSPTVAELFGTASHGSLFGIVLFCGTIGGAIGPIMAGYTFDVTGSYHPMFLAMTGLLAIAFVLVFFLRPVKDVPASQP